MQNKPNFRKSQMNLNFYSQMAYENKSNWTLSENKAKTNPISEKAIFLVHKLVSVCKTEIQKPTVKSCDRP